MTAHLALQVIALACLLAASVPRVVSSSWVHLGWLGLFCWLLGMFV